MRLIVIIMCITIILLSGACGKAKSLSLGTEGSGGAPRNTPTPLQDDPPISNTPPKPIAPNVPIPIPEEVPYQMVGPNGPLLPAPSGTSSDEFWKWVAVMLALSPKPTPPPMKTWQCSQQGFVDENQVSSAKTNDSIFTVVIPLLGLNPKVPHVLHIAPSPAHCTGIGLTAGIVESASGQYLAGAGGRFQGNAVALPCRNSERGGCFKSSFSVPLLGDSQWLLSPNDFFNLRFPGSFSLVIDWVYNTGGTCAGQDEEGFALRHSYGIAVLLRPESYLNPPAPDCF